MLYDLRRADVRIKWLVTGLLATLGLSYLFGAVMVALYAGFTPQSVAATYAGPEMSMAMPPETTMVVQRPMSMADFVGPEVHTVDTNLLIQDTHVHVPMYGLIAAALGGVVAGLSGPRGTPEWERRPAAARSRGGESRGRRGGVLRGHGRIDGGRRAGVRARGHAPRADRGGGGVHAAGRRARRRRHESDGRDEAVGARSRRGRAHRSLSRAQAGRGGVGGGCRDRQPGRESRRIRCRGGGQGSRPGSCRVRRLL